MALAKENRKYTFQDYLSWDESQRVEIFSGRAVVMQAAPSTEHQRILGKIFRQISNFLDGRTCEAFVAPFAVRLFDQKNTPDDQSMTVVEPDISVVCDPQKIDEHGCKGAPDFIIEILSPSTMKNDLFEKMDLYRRAQTQEYWIVSPTDQFVQVYVLENGKYTVSGLYGANDTISATVLKGCAVDLSSVFH